MLNDVLVVCIVGWDDKLSILPLSFFSFSLHWDFIKVEEDVLL